MSFGIRCRLSGVVLRWKTWRVEFSQRAAFPGESSGCEFKFGRDRFSSRRIRSVLIFGANRSGGAESSLSGKVAPVILSYCVILTGIKGVIPGDLEFAEAGII
jgi:hypothetical protein